MKDSERDAGYTAYVAARQVRLRAIAFGLTGDWHRADDLLQVSLTKLYVAWPRLVRKGEEDAYVRKILVRTHIDDHRRATRRPERLGLTHADDRAVPGPDLEQRDAVLDALSRLPARQRATLVLRHWADLSVEETARALGLSEGTVKSHTSRAIASMARLLEESDHTAGRPR